MYEPNLKIFSFPNSGFVDEDKIQDYKKFHSKYSKKGKGKSFKSAIDRMDEFILDPVVLYL